MSFQRTLIIAEAGVNHNGSVDIALEMVDVAVKAGADIIKFQTFVPELTVIETAQQAEYQKQNIGKATSQLEMLSKLTLTFAEHQRVADYCRSKGIEYLSTAFDLVSLQELLKLGVARLKIPSGEITHWPLLAASANTKLPIILSTGMANLDEVQAAYNTLIEQGAMADSITVLHCNTQYPTPIDDVNLCAMNTIEKELDVKVGYSDHTLGIEVALAAVARGACVIEKHFTLDKNMEGPDHKASLSPQELYELVAGIRRIEKILGKDEKGVTESEVGNKHIARKYLVAKFDIRKGEQFTPDNLIAKRIGYEGVSPMLWPRIIGQVAKRNLVADEVIQMQDLE